ncbi:hypothetical protein GMDG_04763 [Pseudogymnoascus destructans 20631-21]|uniref:Uncharacterized protein n=2 Tax=Pseudogymnoascus destructans TaxID=655981 RepID=L8GBM3_PSED2|nr:hypothetical protein GMDG_04763 [Pseudogymnoascus destructans 20631-21]
MDMNRFLQWHIAWPKMGVESQPRHPQILRRQWRHPLRRNRDQRPIEGSQHADAPRQRRAARRHHRPRFQQHGRRRRCGLAAFRDWTAYIGVVRSGDSYSVVIQEGLTQNSTDWSTVSTGTTVETAAVENGRIWLRSSMDSRGDGSKLVTFQYSTDGTSFVDLGDAYTMNTDWAIFMGYRWGIFNHATTALGGSVQLELFMQT